MKKIWLITDPRIRRDRRGKPYKKKTLCIQLDDLLLVGEKASSSSSTEYHVMPQVMKVLRILALRFPYLVSRDDVIDYLWPDPDYEPEYAYNVVSVCISRAREVLVPLGWHIVTRNSFGYWLEKSVAIRKDCNAGERSVILPENMVMSPASGELVHG